MNFFEHQERARRNTGLLVFFFALAVVGIVIAVYALLTIALGFADLRHEAGWWRWDVFGYVAAGVLILVGVGSLYKTAQLSSGGRAVAELLGGRPVSADPHDADERKLRNVVEEMSIAAGLPVPALYVMDGEEGINAFAAGFTTRDAAIGVTRGCIAQLSRDELQGVIAHEFSHILNGDMRLNIRLTGVLHGILCLAMAGYILLRSGAYSRRNKNAGGILALGLGLVVIGYIGVFFSRLIQAAVSRQREFLADASAVQLTRQPWGIAGALKKIGGFARGSQIATPHARETGHFFFGNALKSGLFQALATHPPLAERIQRIEKGFDPARLRADAAAAAAGGEPRVAGFAGGTTRADEFVASVGNPSPEHFARAPQALQSLPLEVSAALHDPFRARVVIHALLLDQDRAGRREQLRLLTAQTDGRTLAELQNLSSAIDALPRAMRLPLVDLALPALRELGERQYRAFARELGVLVEADQRVDLFEFCVQKILTRHLATGHDERPTRRVKYRTLAPLRRECEVLLSALARVGHDAETDAAQAFGPALQSVFRGDGEAPRLLAAEACGVRAVGDALDRLEQAAPYAKQAVLRASAMVAAHDGVIRPAEAELLRAVADALDCPVPPLL